MQGIQILNSTVTYGGGYWWIGIIVAIVALAISIIAFVGTGGITDSTMYIIMIISVVLGVAIGVVCETTVHSKPIYITHETLVSDDVSLNEVIEKYEVVGHEGKITILKENIED